MWGKEIPKFKADEMEKTNVRLSGDGGKNKLILVLCIT